ncbi:hypothetical protein ACO0LL_28530 [Undibacterium sp. TC4M20W]|uniref:hypothetical protein n=1 Tax=unclassified Undibacterium TaxID=2630295 RepID=UPI003BF18361
MKILNSLERSKKFGIAVSGAMLITLAFGSQASAATYYVADCAKSTSVSPLDTTPVSSIDACKPGNDQASGTSPAEAWRTAAKVQSNMRGFTAGDKILFARGGAWDDVAMIIENYQSSTANPIVFDAYNPSWVSGKDAPKPILFVRKSVPNVDPNKSLHYAAITVQGKSAYGKSSGYAIRNIDFRGRGEGHWGVMVYQEGKGGLSDVEMSNLNVEGNVIGIQCQPSIQAVKLLNSTITNNSSQGILWGCNSSLIEGNTLNYNGYANGTLDHSIYIGNEQADAGEVTVRANKLYKNSLPPLSLTSKCGGVAIVGHGHWTKVTIEDNLIQQEENRADAGCWGISVDAAYQNIKEVFTNVNIHRNTLVNVGNVGIGCAACISPFIENNVLVWETTPEWGGPTGIRVPVNGVEPGDAADTGATIRNNTIYFKKTVRGSIGIELANQNGATPGQNLKVLSNLIYFGPLDAAIHSNWELPYCFGFGAPKTTQTGRDKFTAFDNNLCYASNASDLKYSADILTLAEAKGKQFDFNGLNTDPLLSVPSVANEWKTIPAKNSPVIDKGASVDSALDDRLGKLRVKPDIGAFEYAGGAVDTIKPVAPTNFTVK